VDGLDGRQLAAVHQHLGRDERAPLFAVAGSVRATFLIAALSTLGFVYLAGRFALGLWAF
jgi:hypothetical protein